jgi:succinyl-CoA synthetase alpha subunit
LIGTGFVPLLRLFENDPDTRGVVLFGEPGTGHEEEVAELVHQGGFTKTLVARVVGEAVENLPKGMSFGHTSTIVERGLGSPIRKKRLLRESGVKVAESLSEIPMLVEEGLGLRLGVGN